MAGMESVQCFGFRVRCVQLTSTFGWRLVQDSCAGLKLCYCLLLYITLHFKNYSLDLIVAIVVELNFHRP